jgi:hypothetical protein
VTRGLKADVDAAAVAPLSELGFRKRKAGIFTCEVADGVLGWAGLNSGRGGEWISIHPVIGVRHQGVEQLVAELRQMRFHPYIPPTISTPLYELVSPSRYQTWDFYRDGTMPQRAADLAAAIEHYGLPFMRSATGLEELRRLIEADYGPVPEELAYRHAVVCLLAGDLDGALAGLDAALAGMSGRHDPAAVLFREFAERFRAFAEHRPLPPTRAVSSPHP